MRRIVSSRCTDFWGGQIQMSEWPFLKEKWFGALKGPGTSLESICICRLAQASPETDSESMLLWGRVPEHLWASVSSSVKWVNNTSQIAMNYWALECIRHHINSHIILPETQETVTNGIPILQEWKLRTREGKGLAQGYTACAQVNSSVSDP